MSKLKSSIVLTGLASLGLTLAGCGKTGALYLPETGTSEKVEGAAPQPDPKSEQSKQKKNSLTDKKIPDVILQNFAMRTTPPALHNRG